MKLSNSDIDRAMDMEERGVSTFAYEIYGSILSQCLSALKTERELGFYDGSYSEAVNALEKHGFDLSERGDS